MSRHVKHVKQLAELFDDIEKGLQKGRPETPDGGHPKKKLKGRSNQSSIDIEGINEKTTKKIKILSNQSSFEIEDLNVDARTTKLLKQLSNQSSIELEDFNIEVTTSKGELDVDKIRELVIVNIKTENKKMLEQVKRMEMRLVNIEGTLILLRSLRN